MKKSTKILLLTAAALSALALLAACAGGGETSSVAPSAPPEDLSEIKDTAAAFIDAVREQNVVKMETMGGVPVDTYGDWSKPTIEKITSEEVSVTAEKAVYRLVITVADNGGAEKIDVGENRYTLTVTYDADSGVYEFDFTKDE